MSDNQNETLLQLLQEMKEHREKILPELKAQQEQIAKHGETSEKTGERIDALDQKMQELHEEYNRKLEEEQKRIDEMEADRKAVDLGEPEEETKGPGDLLVESDEFKSYLESRSSHSQPVQVKSLFPERKATLTTGAATRLVPPQRTSMVEPLTRRLTIRDLLMVAPTQSNAIEYLREIGFAADGAGGGTQTQGAADMVAEGAAKPEAQIEFELATASVETVAHWIPVSRQILNDAPAMRAYVNRRLLYGVEFKEEQQLLYGSGTTPQLHGITTRSGIQTYTESVDGGGSDTLIDSFRRMMTLGHVSEYVPDTIIVNPQNFEDLELTKGSDGHYVYLQIPVLGAPPMFFRVPLLVTNALTVDTALVGNFAIGAMLWDREQANIRVSDSHDDLFTKNAVAVLAEERVCLTVFREDAFVLGDLDQNGV